MSSNLSYNSFLSSTDESNSVGFSGFLSNIGLSWPAAWSVVHHDHEPPPIDMTTPLDPAGRCLNSPHTMNIHSINMRCAVSVFIPQSQDCLKKNIMSETIIS